MTTFTSQQKRVLMLAWVTYAAFYLGRVNLAPAILAIQEEFDWTGEQIGFLVGAALWTYALGQVFNGWLGERLPPRRIVFIGLTVSALINIVFGFAQSLPVMIGLWLTNGFFQSMGWGPILRTLRDNLADDQRQRIAGVFGTSYVVGNTLTWLLLSWLLRFENWRLAFFVPGVLMLGFAAIWLFLSPSGNTAQQTGAGENPPQLKIALRPLVAQFWPLFLAILVTGALLNGTLNYAPTYAAQSLTLDSAALVAIAFPVCGLIGTAWLSSWIVRRFHKDTLRGVLALLLLNAAIRAVGIFAPNTPVTALVLLAAMGITSYALTNLVLTAVPLMALAQFGTSFIAGLTDALHSIGGAVGSLVTGLVIARGDWSLTFTLWALLPLAAIVAIITTRSLSVFPVKETYLEEKS
jgi:OPA family glycerol-3-phosphate transporter-like MFS transporter